MDREQAAQEVEAEVIENEATTLEVTYTEATIASNFDALEAHVRKVVSEYDGAVYDLTSAQAVKEAKHDRSYLNGIKKEIDERRKAVKREYSKPLDAFEKRCKRITAIIDESSDAIKAQLDEAEQARKDALHSRLQQHYEEFAGLLAPVVPYERLHEHAVAQQDLRRDKGAAGARGQGVRRGPRLGNAQGPAGGDAALRRRGARVLPHARPRSRPERGAFGRRGRPAHRRAEGGHGARARAGAECPEPEPEPIASTRA